MLPRPRGIIFSSVSRAVLLAGIVVLLLPISLMAQQHSDRVLCREEISQARREELAGKLRKISGLSELKFDNDGVLRLGTRVSVGGSPSARQLLARALHGPNIVVIEDAGKRSEVAFARVIPAKWKQNSAAAPPAFVIQIDFADFDQLVGDEIALEAFNVGWAVLHELDHVAHDSSDASVLGETGECESNINQMRRECGLPERASYFSTLFPVNADSQFITKFVRIAFAQPQAQAQTSRKKTYWVMWDANVVGGLDQNQVAMR